MTNVFTVMAIPGLSHVDKYKDTAGELADNIRLFDHALSGPADRIKESIDHWHDVEAYAKGTFSVLVGSFTCVNFASCGLEFALLPKSSYQVCFRGEDGVLSVRGEAEVLVHTQRVWARADNAARRDITPPQ
ncbi:hypothetical protein [Natronoglycomyces albus]|uniref:Uncharacterized protein n=1 Tax=Natronoglycomyces albus TaxID=2811108 RepID=A0A895XNZ7_9ACTN|nr:hypothetical protein [Natronoglycomyces albus]QSB05109.1 hypothetical protein JQS30_15330 [Natronoglycomyces albus]